MAVKQTSLLSYSQLDPDSLGFMHTMVLDYFNKHPESTDMEICKISGYSENQIRPRRNELVKMGYLGCNGYRKCHVTGKTAMVWGVR